MSDPSTMGSEATYVVKFQRGGSGIKRATFDAAVEAAVERRPARVYRVGRPNVLIAVVHVDGGVDKTAAANDLK